MALPNTIAFFKSTFRKLFKIRSDRSDFIPKTPSEKLAFLISRIFGPIPLLVMLWLLTALKSGIGFWKALWVYPLIFVLALLIPTLITSLFIAKRKTDIEWQKIDDRKKYLIPITIASLINLNILVYFLTTPTAFHLSLLFSAIVISMSAIWVIFNFKISGHMVVATVTLAGVVLFLGFQFIWLGILLLPLMWARRTLKVHTWPELLSGIAMPFFLMLLAVLVFGWPKIG